MIIRKMLEDDFAHLLRLWAETPGVGVRAADDTCDRFSSFLQRNPSTCLVAESSGCIVGGIMAGHDGRRGHIYHMAVRASEQRNGIGTALLNAALYALAFEGISKVCLVAYTENNIGNAFWEKRGFHVRNDLLYRDRLISQADFSSK